MPASSSCAEQHGGGDQSRLQHLAGGEGDRGRHRRQRRPSRAARRARTTGRRARPRACRCGRRARRARAPALSLVDGGRLGEDLPALVGDGDVDALHPGELGARTPPAPPAGSGPRAPPAPSRRRVAAARPPPRRGSRSRPGRTARRTAASRPSASRTRSGCRRRRARRRPAGRPTVRPCRSSSRASARSGCAPASSAQLPGELGALRRGARVDDGGEQATAGVGRHAASARSPAPRRRSRRSPPRSPACGR